MRNLVPPVCVLALWLLGSGLFSRAADKIAPTAAPLANPAVQANNTFACDLYRKLSQGQAGKNVFFSPYSISSALAMTMEGARGQTAEEMGKVLCLPESLHESGAAAKTVPWKTAAYHLGFNALNGRLGKPADAAKDQAARRQLAELRPQLAKVNNQVNAWQGRFNDPKIQALQAQARKLAAAINSLNKEVDTYELNVANAIWGEKTYPFDPNYFDAISKYYGSDVLRQADLRGNFSEERTRINRWVLQKTNDRIKDLIPSFEPDVARQIRMILVNAIFFKGQWTTPFDAKQTKPEPFFLADGGKAVAPLMHVHQNQARYAAFNADGTFFATPARIPFQGGDKVPTYPERDGTLMVELPVKGDKLAMVVLAPQDAGGLAALEARLTGPNVTAWLAKLEKRGVQVALPKFKMETDYSLGQTLEKMGMKEAFSDQRADFTGMTTSRSPDDRLYISLVLHKAFVEVNEQGAEAAAATAVIMAAPTGAPADTPFTPSFRADRPFIFLIRDLETGAILFLGRVNQP